MKKLVKKRTIGKISFYFSAIFFISIFIGVGYAYLNSQLSIKGQTTIAKASWDVHFENVATNDSTAIKFYAANDTSFSSALTNIASLSGTTLNYTVNLTGPDSTAETTHDMTADIVNNGTIDATISSATLPTESTMTSVTPANASSYVLKNVIKIKCTYSDGTEIKTGDVIKAGASKTIKCTHHYKSPSELTNAEVVGFGSLSGSAIVGKTSLTLNFTAK